MSMIPKTIIHLLSGGLDSVTMLYDLKAWLGLNYEGNIYYADNHCPAQVLRNCVHPIIGAQILEAARTPNSVYPTEKR